MTLEIFVAILIGCVLGVVGTLLLNYVNSAHGVLRIDHSDPNKDLYRFEIDDLSKLNDKTYVELTIDHHADLSR